MARGRMINRTVPTDSHLSAFGSEFGPWALVLHHRLLAFLDLNGNVRADEHWLKATIFPRDAGMTAADCRTFARGLAAHGLAVLYEVDGMPFLNFPAFSKNQGGIRTDREKPEYPECTEDNKIQDVGNLPEDCPAIGWQVAGQLAGSSPDEVKRSLTLTLTEAQLNVNVKRRKDSGEVPVNELESRIVSDWNELHAEFPKIPEVKKLNPTRKAHIRERNKEPEFDWAAIKLAIRASPYLRGEVKNWAVFFDWVFDSKTNYIKILEGNYADRSNGNAQPIPEHVKQRREWARRKQPPESEASSQDEIKPV